jgi:hypothetical protein
MIAETPNVDKSLTTKIWAIVAAGKEIEASYRDKKAQEVQHVDDLQCKWLSIVNVALTARTGEWAGPCNASPHEASKTF